MELSTSLLDCNCLNHYCFRSVCISTALDWSKSPLHYDCLQLRLYISTALEMFTSLLQYNCKHIYCTMTAYISTALEMYISLLHEICLHLYCSKTVYISYIMSYVLSYVISTALELSSFLTAEGFGRGFLCPSDKKKSLLCCFGPFMAIFCAQ